MCVRVLKLQHHCVSGRKLRALTACSIVAALLPSALPDVASAQGVVLDDITVRSAPQRAGASRSRDAAPGPSSPEAQPSLPVEAAERGGGPVQGFVATQSVSGTKTDTPIREIPQSISVVTQDQIEAQGAQNVSQALRYTPGVFSEINGESAHYDETRIRGFRPYSYLDGLLLPLNRFYGTPRIETWGLERIEVLRGPSSVLYGQNSPGGLINMISKKPKDVAFGEIELQTGSYDRMQGAFDFGGPATADKSVLYRFVGLVRDADTMVDYAKDRRQFFAPSVTIRNLDTSLTLLGQWGKDQGGYPQTFLPAQGTLYYNPNGQIPRNRFIGEPGWDNFSREQWSVGYQFDHRFNEVWQFRQNLRQMSVDATWQAHRSEGLQPNLISLERGAYSQSTDASTFNVDNQLQADFATGPLQHKLLFGLDYVNTKGNWDFRVAFPTMWGGPITPINVFKPSYGSLPPAALTPRNNNFDTQKQTGIYAQDQIKFDRWILTLGGRHDWSEVSTEDRLLNSFVSEKNQATTWRAGLSYNFDNGVTPYVAAATSFEQEIGVDAFGDPFKPTTGIQYEAGIKYQPVGTKSLFTAAIFDLKRENIVTANPVTFIATQAGEARVKGLELEAKVSVTDRFDLTASYSYLDSDITRSTNPYEIGRPLPMTPQNQASGWMDYVVLPGMKIGGGVRYVGENYSEVETREPLLIPSVVLYDAMLQYDFSVLAQSLKGLSLRINATNLFDKYYVTYCYQYAYCSLGPGRTVLATMSYRW